MTSRDSDRVSWEESRKLVRDFRKQVYRTQNPNVLSTIKDFCFDERNGRLYFIKTDYHRSHERNPNIHAVDFAQLPVPPDRPVDERKRMDIDSPFGFGSTTFVAQMASLPRLAHKTMFPHQWHREKISDAESPKRGPVNDRKKIGVSTPYIDNYTFDPINNRLIFNWAGNIYVSHLDKDKEACPRLLKPHAYITLDEPPVIINHLPTLTSQFSAVTTPATTHMSPLGGMNFTSPSSPFHLPPMFSPIMNFNPTQVADSEMSSGLASPSSPDSVLHVHRRSGAVGPDTPSPNRSDAKLGGRYTNLIAFVRGRDLWVTSLHGVEMQLTFCNGGDSGYLSCGTSEFVMQEEFHRYTGYYWAPSDKVPRSGRPEDGKPERILYMQVSEEMVDSVAIPRAGEDMEEYRYPRAGGNNAKCDLQIVEFYADELVEGVTDSNKRKIPTVNTPNKPNPINTRFAPSPAANYSSGFGSPLTPTQAHTNAKSHIQDSAPVHKRLWGEWSIQEMFPWAEYAVRFGWINASSIWVQLLDRLQSRTAVIKVPIDNFLSFTELQIEMGEVRVSSSDPDENDKTYSDFRFEKANEMIEIVKKRKSSTEVVWEEEMPSWVNVSDVYHFFDTSEPDHTCLIWSSEASGYRHLYYVSKKRSLSSSAIVPLTWGSWPVCDRPIQVDSDRKLIYFTGKRETPLEAHLYVVSYADAIHWAEQIMSGKRDVDSVSSYLRRSPCHLVRLTELGFSHHVVINTACTMFVDCFSAIDIPMSAIVWDISCTQEFKKFGADMPSNLNVEKTNGRVVFGGDYEGYRTPIVGVIAGRKELRYPPERYMQRPFPVGLLFTFKADDGSPLHGCLYRPQNYQAGQSYPTILNIYGGPRSQLVTNDYKFPRFLRHFLASKLGFAVVTIDGRGSSDRGLEFESYIKHRMGLVELSDQIRGLRFLSESRFGAIAPQGRDAVSVIDMDRIAIAGWSYGGYLSLMGIAQYPHIFKVCIAGAPVTRWQLYDSAYTERYMGLPKEGVEGYEQADLVKWAGSFPDGENRVLIAHGLMDENVHFRHTEALVAALIAYNKPHQVQVYPSERHGLRHASVNEHFETLMFFWLLNYL
ncbi:hypothetical protein BZG36_03610 [Bifiguratus adelaidae]|uniref:Dipeptidyl-peptidase IV n=1 Tax=Bifiguratus adelaidae TaxID=1938954 RepID=A0A261XZY2_9FUNG|nr:hypothetical protein BZG36_03610 [Bifiguratus adelaidae]